MLHSRRYVQIGKVTNDRERRESFRGIERRASAAVAGDVPPSTFAPYRLPTTVGL